ncbi:cysteine-rich venom protein [Patella vulgata]|uniref:cysteine-rich venom protein n=1 Tax=Patella vulgata TaxID=6465 RepID=UPI0024A9F62B|nr:cysteine-rich venom protein [Patella vulgata]
MQKMAWDDELAKIATKWAQQCRSGHDTGVARTAISLPNIYNGQNMAAGMSTFVGAVTAWHDEVVDYQYGVVQHKSARVGCGQADCDGTQYYICNYAIGLPVWVNI